MSDGIVQHDGDSLWRPRSRGPRQRRPAHVRYETFALRLESGPGSSYTVVVQSPLGEERGTFEAPRSHPPLTSEAAALEVGKNLFRALFRDQVANLFHASLGSLRNRHQGLRIQIAVDPRCAALAPLQELSWEVLCRPETEDFLSLDRRTPVVRSLDAHRQRRPALPRPRRLRILAIAASPSDQPALDLARERSHLTAAWKGQEKEVEIVFLARGGLEALRQACLETDFHVLHFMGHGRFDESSGQGELVFEREDGASQPCEGRLLAQLLQGFESLRLVVLNACHTAEAVGTHGPQPFAGVASALVMGGMPAVVAMSGPVSDSAAVAFSCTLYQRLAAGDAIEEAMTEGRLAVQRAEPGAGAWATPTLFLRSQDGRLFAPRSTVLARRAALIAVLVVALALAATFAASWWQERRADEAMRLNNKGLSLLELDRKEEARDAFRAALTRAPDDAATLGNLAVAELQLGDAEGALAHARAAVRASPNEAVHHYNLGALLALRKRHEEALPHLQRAIALDTTYTHAYNELGNVYLELGHPAEARKSLEAGLAHDRTLAKLHKNLARTALAEGKPDQARSHLEKALASYPSADLAGRVEATYWLAATQEVSGRTAEICGTLGRFATFDPQWLSPFGRQARQLAERHGCIP